MTWPVTPAAAAGAVGSLQVGALVLATVLLVLYLTRQSHRPRHGLVPAAALGTSLVLAAIAASSTEVVAKEAFLDWRGWDPYDAPRDPVSVRYVWNSNYTGIRFPEEETVVLRIKAPKRPLYWRATTLDTFTGVGWRESVEPGGQQEIESLDAGSRDPLLPDAAFRSQAWVQQQVTVVALADTHLVAAAYPMRWRSDQRRQLQPAEGGVVFAPGGLERGETYTVWSYVPEVEPNQLIRLPGRYPSAAVRYLDLVPGVRLPAFDAPDRDGRVRDLFAGSSDDMLLGAYERVYGLAKEIVGNGASPYVAAVTLEAWLRDQGGFTYDEQPAQPIDSTPPLVDFLLRTKEGYCQQYAGSMALMLRLLGVPARVAAGFTSGEYDDRRGEWIVTDHNAHTWVEVYFPRFGWLPFDPTPGRGELSGAYSTASRAFPSTAEQALGISPDGLSAILRQRLQGAERRLSAPTAAGEVAANGGGPGIVPLLVAMVAALPALFLATKAVRRALRFRSTNPRHVATACRRDLVAFLVDQRMRVSESVTLTELGELVRYTYGVEAAVFVAAAQAARFGPPDRAPVAARSAREELTRLRRNLGGRLAARDRIRGAMSVRSMMV